MKKIFFIMCFFVFFSTKSEGQEYKLLKPSLNLYLINSLDTTIQVKLEGNVPTDIFYNVPFTDTAIQYSRIMSEGFISSINDTAITFISSNEETHLKYKKNDFVITKNISLSKLSDNFDLMGISKNINLIDVEHLRYRNPKKQTLIKIGWSIYAVASVTGIVGAVVAISNDNANAGKVLYGSAATILCVSVPILIIGKKKNYKITERHKKKETGYWYLDSK